MYEHVHWLVALGSRDALPVDTRRGLRTAYRGMMRGEGVAKGELEGERLRQTYHGAFLCPFAALSENFAPR